MSRAKLKKYIASLPKEQVEQIVLDLYDARKSAREFLEFFLNPDENAALEKAKKDLQRLYFTPQGRPRARMSVKAGNDLVADFSKLGTDTVKVADLMLYHVEVLVSRLAARRIIRETAWDSVVTLFRKAVDLITSVHAGGVFDRRIGRIIDYMDEIPSYLRMRERLQQELSESGYHETDNS